MMVIKYSQRQVEQVRKDSWKSSQLIETVLTRGVASLSPLSSRSKISTIIFYYNYLLFSSLPITAEEILYGAHVGENKILKLEPHVAITVGSSHDIEHRGWIPRIGEKIERFRILQV